MRPGRPDITGAPKAPKAPKGMKLPTVRQPQGRTGAAAAGYTLVATIQKVSGFLLLIAFTRVLSPEEYGQVALLTTVGALLTTVLTLGLEPRITYAYFQAGTHLPAYLRAAKRASTFAPLSIAAVVAIALALFPIGLRAAWILECVGACLLAAGTTYAYAVLRAARRVIPYTVLALSILVTQVTGRIVMVGALGWGAAGWAASDFVAGILALAVGRLLVRERATERAPVNGNLTMWRVTREGLPLVPHYLAQWGLSLSDRIVLAFFVTTADVGIYSAIYQIAAVTSLVLNEVNRAFMPLYAQYPPASPELPPLVRNHVRVAFALHGIFLVCGFAAIEIVLPPAYREHAEIYPLLALSALTYGLYFVPMNALTLVAGRSSPAPLVSLSALTVNLALNLALDSVWGLWGAVLGTLFGYIALVAIAMWFETRLRAVQWRAVLSKEPLVNATWVAVVVATATSTFPGALRICSLATVGALTVVALVITSGTHRTPAVEDP